MRWNRVTWTNLKHRHFREACVKKELYVSLYNRNKSCITVDRKLWKRYSIYQSTNFHSITTFILWVDNFFNCLMIVSTTKNKITFHIPPIFTILIKKYGSNLWTITCIVKRKIIYTYVSIIKKMELHKDIMISWMYDVINNMISRLVCFF